MFLRILFFKNSSLNNTKVLPRFFQLTWKNNTEKVAAQVTMTRDRNPPAEPISCHTFCLSQIDLHRFMLPSSQGKSVPSDIKSC